MGTSVPFPPSLPLRVASGPGHPEALVSRPLPSQILREPPLTARDRVAPDLRWRGLSSLIALVCQLWLMRGPALRFRRRARGAETYRITPDCLRLGAPAAGTVESRQGHRG